MAKLHIGALGAYGWYLWVPSGKVFMECGGPMNILGVALDYLGLDPYEDEVPLNGLPWGMVHDSLATGEMLSFPFFS